MIKLGIIGVANPEFRDVFSPALKQLGKKIRVVGIYDSVRKRAEQAAAMWETQACPSFQKLIERRDTDAILVLSPSWQGMLPIAECLEMRKPVFCTQAVWQEGLAAEALEEIAQANDALLVIESRFRYWPTSLRARELQACEMGKPLRIICQTPQTQSQDLSALSTENTLADLLDWSRFLLQRSQILPEPKRGEEGCLCVEFARQRGGTILDTIPVELKSVCADDQSEKPVLIIDCETGSIQIFNANRLVWQRKSGGQTEEPHEELLQEQSCVFRQIDHFCRRVAGGLIPVHDLADALWAKQAALTVGKS